MRLDRGRYIQPFDLLVVGKIVGDVAGALALAVLLHHLGNLRHDRLLGGGRIALGIEFAGPLGIPALRIECGQAHFIAPWKTREAVELAMLEWVAWFNHHRLLEPLGYMPPAEAEANYYKQLSSQATPA
jgi:hypothetical protein